MINKKFHLLHQSEAVLRGGSILSRDESLTGVLENKEMALCVFFQNMNDVYINIYIGDKESLEEFQALARKFLFADITYFTLLQKEVPSLKDLQLKEIALMEKAI